MGDVVTLTPKEKTSALNEHIVKNLRRADILVEKIILHSAQKYVNEIFDKEPTREFLVLEEEINDVIRDILVSDPSGLVFQFVKERVSFAARGVHDFMSILATRLTPESFIGPQEEEINGANTEGRS